MDAGPDDNLVASKEITPSLVSWYIKIIGSDAEDTKVTDDKGRTYTRNDTADSLENGKKARGRIAQDEFNYWIVETCDDSKKLTIELSSIKKSKNAKVSLLASYGGFPSGDISSDDYVRVDMDDSYFAELILDDSGHLPIRPGELLYLSVQKTDTNATERAVYDIMAKWDGDCDDQDLPEISSVERLTDSDVSKLASIDGEGITSFVWNIPSGTSSALLEVTGLTVDADVELLSSNGRYFRNSINPDKMSEQIVLREGDFISSLEGDWLVLVKNRDTRSGEFKLNTSLGENESSLISSQAIQLDIESQYWPAIVRLNWPTVPGERYTLEYSKDLVDWIPVKEKLAETDGLVLYVERLWFSERFYRIRQKIYTP